MSFLTTKALSAGTAAAALALALASCAAPRADTAAVGGPPPPPVPRLVPTPKPANLGLVERYAWITVEQLGEALAAGDAPAFLAKVSNGFYKGYTTLESSLRELVATTTARSVIVAVDSVEVEGGRVSVRARWVRDFATRAGVRSAAQGSTTFLFLGTDTALRLLDYRGDPPFGIPGI